MTRGDGKEELGKEMGPLFPRLHISDAGKGGGPRAPPRNKMALYEQLTVPSNRFSSRAAGGSLVPSTSSAAQDQVPGSRNEALISAPQSPCYLPLSCPHGNLGKLCAAACLHSYH